MPRTLTFPAAALVAVAAVAAAGCGGTSAPAAPDEAKVIVPGPIVYQDPLTDNRGGWFTFEDKVVFKDGKYSVLTPPLDRAPSGGFSGADALAPDKIPPNIQTSVTVTASRGDALRGLTCRAFSPSQDQGPVEAYELMVDGRLAMIRRLVRDQQPRVLAKQEHAIPKDVPVRLSAQCVEGDGGGLVMVLKVDGTEVVRATDPSPLPATREAGPVYSGDLRYYTRADSQEPALLVWTDYEVRSAAFGKQGS